MRLNKLKIKTMFGNKKSKSNLKTKRKFLINKQRIAISIKSLGTFKMKLKNKLRKTIKLK
ncbi:large ribosomal subunit protein bL28 [Candidatus Vidania fulgoroideorum]